MFPISGTMRTAGQNARQNQLGDPDAGLRAHGAAGEQKLNCPGRMLTANAAGTPKLPILSAVRQCGASVLSLLAKVGS